MNWDALGAVGELVGAAAVVVTLLYLVKEMRLNRVAAESDSVDSLSNGLNAMNLQVANDPEMSEIFMKGFTNPNELSEIQLMRFALIGQTLINQFTTIKKHYEAGTLPESEWNTYCSGTCQLMSGPGGEWLCENIAISPEILRLFQEYPGDKSSSPYFWQNKREP